MKRQRQSAAELDVEDEVDVEEEGQGEGEGKEKVRGLYDESSQGSGHVDPATMRQLLDEAWVQCERPDCFKWRSMPKGAVLALDPAIPWFCAMNPDPARQECSAVQERYSVHRVRECGLSYVTSVLPLGTLVLAQVPGFCSWPGLVVVDSFYSQSVELDCDGDPVMYHIEFLGKRRSRCWVGEDSVELYGRPAALAALRASRTSKATREKFRTTYQGSGVMDAITEADSLIRLDLVQRLARCLYHCGQPVSKKKQNLMNLKEKSARKSTIRASTSGKTHKPCFSIRKNTSTGHENLSECDSEVKNNESEKKKQKKEVVSFEAKGQESCSELCCDFDAEENMAGKKSTDGKKKKNRKNTEAKKPRIPGATGKTMKKSSEQGVAKATCSTSEAAADLKTDGDVERIDGSVGIWTENDAVSEQGRFDGNTAGAAMVVKALPSLLTDAVINVGKQVVMKKKVVKKSDSKQPSGKEESIEIKAPLIKASETQARKKSHKKKSDENSEPKKSKGKKSESNELSLEPKKKKSKICNIDVPLFKGGKNVLSCSNVDVVEASQTEATRVAQRSSDAAVTSQGIQDLVVLEENPLFEWDSSLPGVMQTSPMEKGTRKVDKKTKTVSKETDSNEKSMKKLSLANSLSDDARKDAIDSEASVEASQQPRLATKKSTSDGKKKFCPPVRQATGPTKGFSVPSKKASILEPARPVGVTNHGPSQSSVIGCQIVKSQSSNQIQKIAAKADEQKSTVAKANQNLISTQSETQSRSLFDEPESVSQDPTANQPIQVLVKSSQNLLKSSQTDAEGTKLTEPRPENSARPNPSGRPVVLPDCTPLSDEEESLDLVVNNEPLDPDDLSGQQCRGDADGGTGKQSTAVEEMGVLGESDGKLVVREVTGEELAALRVSCGDLAVLGCPLTLEALAALGTTGDDLAAKFPAPSDAAAKGTSALKHITAAAEQTLNETFSDLYHDESIISRNPSKKPTGYHPAQGCSLSKPIDKPDLNDTLMSFRSNFDDLADVPDSPASRRAQNLVTGPVHALPAVEAFEALAAETCSTPSVASPAPRWFRVGEQRLEVVLGRSASMVGRSKEEKYSLDVQMYKENEAGYERDLKQFMASHGRPIRKLPFWQSKLIGLFDLFVAVYDLGGYDKVSEGRAWKAIYRELTGVSTASANCGIAARNYYTQNLLAYELYITGREYLHLFNKDKPATTKKPSTTPKSPTPLKPFCATSPGVRKGGETPASLAAVRKDGIGGAVKQSEWKEGKQGGEGRVEVEKAGVVRQWSSQLEPGDGETENECFEDLACISPKSNLYQLTQSRLDLSQTRLDLSQPLFSSLNRSTQLGSQERGGGVLRGEWGLLRGEGGVQEVPCFEQLADIRFSDSEGEEEFIVSLKGCRQALGSSQDDDDLKGGQVVNASQPFNGSESKPQQQHSQLMSSEVSHIF